METGGESRNARGWALLLLVLLLDVVLCAGLVMHGWRGVPFVLVGRIYDAHTLWLPALLGAAAAGARLRPRGSAVRPLAPRLLLGATVLLGLRLHASVVELEWLAVRREVVEVPQLDRPLRLLHLSDLQPLRVGWHERRVMAKVRALAPDLLLYTGDLVSSGDGVDYEAELGRMAELLATVAPPSGKFAVFGDADEPLLASGRRDVGGLVLLGSEEVVVPVPGAGGARLRIRGLTLDESRAEVYRTVKPWLATFAPRDVGILMGHAPDFVLSLPNLPVDLCLAGHTHGGQVRIPFYGAPFIGSLVPREMSRGLHHHGRTRIDVSAGAGAEHAHGLPAIRLNCPTEMTLIELRPAVPVKTVRQGPSFPPAGSQPWTLENGTNVAGSGRSAPSYEKPWTVAPAAGSGPAPHSSSSPAVPSSSPVPGRPP